MNNDQLLEQIEQLILPLKTGQEKLVEGQNRLEKKLESFEKRLEAQGKDIKSLKQDVKTLDLKIEVVNTNLEINTKEIADILVDILDKIATQEEVDKLDHRVTTLEEKIGIRS